MQALISWIGNSGGRLIPPRKPSRRPPRCFELVGKKEFAAAALDSESETFVEHVVSLSSDVSPSSSPSNVDPIAGLIATSEFAVAALDSESKTFVVLVTSLSSVASPSASPLNIHRRPRIAGLIAEEALTKVPVKYVDFAGLFSPDLASKVPKH